MSFEVYVRTVDGARLDWTRQQTEKFTVAQNIFDAMKAHSNFKGGPFVLVLTYKDAIVELYSYKEAVVPHTTPPSIPSRHPLH